MRVPALLLVLGSIATGQLEGVYTVDPSKPASSVNFQTLSAAAAAARRVTGHVVFKVKPGTYREVLSLGSVSGASAGATVTFEGDGGTAVLSASPVDPRTGLEIKSGQWYRIRRFKVTNYVQKGIHIDYGRDLLFEDCEIDDGYGLWTQISALFVENNSTRIEFRRCVFRGSGAALCVGGDPQVFDGCEFDGLGKANRLLGSSQHVVTNCFFHGLSDLGTSMTIQWNGIFVHNTVIADGRNSAITVSGASNNWDYPPIVMNNALINLGNGSTITFGGDPAKATIYTAVSDYNCHHAPNSKVMITVGYFYDPIFAGSLGDFRIWQKGGTNRIFPGGATSYDEHSFVADPGLVRMTPPYDIHLQTTSVLIDNGTTQLIPSYTKYPAFSVPRDFEGDLRLGPVDVGADEVASGLTGIGTGAIGTTMELRVSAQRDAGLRYQVGTALGAGPIFIGNRRLGLNFDGILYLSMSGLAPSVFRNYGGVLDAAGKATAELAIPNNPLLKGIDLYSAFVTIRIGAPENIQTISNTFTFRVL